MTRVYLSLGSNIEPRRHIEAGLDALANAFGELIISPVFESEAVGFNGDNFFNLAVGIDTGLSVPALSRQLKSIEAQNGRQQEGPKFSSRTLDIDILTYGDEAGEWDGIKLPREEITKNAFVLWPLAEIAPNDLHPERRVSYARLWHAYDRQQLLWPIDFQWRGEVISEGRK